jgi:GNAT superfamily N-acetyltransferase
LNISVKLGQANNIDELENLYDCVNDYLAEGTNYCGWRKGIYPSRQDAINGVNSGNLFVATYDGNIVGSIILNHEAESAYHNVNWKFDYDYSEICVIHTFLVHPKFMKYGVGKTLLEFAEKYCAKSKFKSIRLDVYEKNIPAINLYEKCGFKYVDTVDLGLGIYGLDWFKLYEKLL